MVKGKHNIESGALKHVLACPPLVATLYRDALVQDGDWGVALSQARLALKKHSNDPQVMAMISEFGKSPTQQAAALAWLQMRSYAERSELPPFLSPYGRYDARSLVAWWAWGLCMAIAQGVMLSLLGFVAAVTMEWSVAGVTVWGVTLMWASIKIASAR